MPPRASRVKPDRLDAQLAETFAPPLTESNPYVGLLNSFRKAYAKWGNSAFILDVVTPEEMGGYEEAGFRYLAHIPLAQDGSGWRVVGKARHRALNLHTDEPWRIYYGLGCLAGASLPLFIRERIPFAPAGPLGWWLCFLWHLKPPTEADLATPPEGCCRAIWPEPFLESVEAIERCKLHTDHPQFPPDEIAAEDKQRLLQPPGRKIPTDGPEGGRWLRWKNERHDIPRGVVYRLLEYMWDRDSAGYDDLVDAEVFDTAVAPGTVRSYTNKVNTALPTGFPWRLSADSVSRQLTKIPAAGGSRRKSLKNP